MHTAGHLGGHGFLPNILYLRHHVLYIILSNTPPPSNTPQRKREETIKGKGVASFCEQSRISETALRIFAALAELRRAGRQAGGQGGAAEVRAKGREMVPGRKDGDKAQGWRGRGRERERERAAGCVVCLCTAGELVKQSNDRIKRSKREKKAEDLFVLPRRRTQGRTESDQKADSNFGFLSVYRQRVS